MKRYEFVAVACVLAGASGCSKPKAAAESPSRPTVAVARVERGDITETLKLEETAPLAKMLAELGQIQGLLEKTRRLGLGVSEPDAVRASAAEFILEGLYSHRRISRNEETGFAAELRRRENPDDSRSSRDDARSKAAKRNYQ